MTIKNSEHYLRTACELAERAQQQGTEPNRPPAMDALTNLARLYTELYGIVLQREVAGLEPVEPELPIAVLDVHDRRWELNASWRFYTSARLPGAAFTLREVREAFGPLRPAEVSRRQEGG